LKIYLAGPDTMVHYSPELSKQRISVMGSYIYVTERILEYFQYWDLFMDSGAYTFAQKNTDITDWNDYVDKYAEFLNAYNIDRFLELDIDKLVGLKEVERLRKRLEQKTGKQPVPVWHDSRGREYFHDMVKEYKYVAIGGIASSKTRERTKGSILYKKYGNWFADKAHEEGAKLHALGFTVQDIHKYRFDSVDSSSWTGGARWGVIFYWNGFTLEKTRSKAKKRLDTAAVMRHNLQQWILYQKHAEGL